ncbi:MAG: caspase family protein [Prevotella sp.]|nr:caspase family protein [Prevotella sp.]
MKIVYMKFQTIMSQLSNKLIFIVLLGVSIPINSYAQTKRALLIGISDYGNAMENPDEWANISGANDVRMLAPKFSHQGFQVDSLVDAQATYKNIIASLSNLATSCKPGDLVYIHFSMHGQPVEDQNGDEEDGWDEALIPVDAKMKFQIGVYEGENHLIDDTLNGFFSNIRERLGEKGTLYVVLDACHSGTASRGDNDHVRGIRDGFSPSGKYYSPDTNSTSNDYFTVESKNTDSPVTYLEACRSYQQNREVRDVQTNIWYGSLSYYISKAMDTIQITNGDEWIENVKTAMDYDRRLRHQNMVIESSKMKAQ